MHFYPKHVELFKDIDSVISNFVLKTYPRTDILSSNAPVMTQGSCFAANFAKALGNMNYAVAHMFVNEWINTTFANAVFFNYVTSDSPKPLTEHLIYEKQVTNFLRGIFDDKAKTAFVDTIRQCRAFVFTVGVAPLWYNKVHNVYCMATEKDRPADYEMRTTDVAHNVANITFTISVLKQINPGIEIFLTLSPAPLNASTEYNSAFEADCVSKSILRVAIDTVIKQNPQVKYWPSFEMVRWLGSHLPPVYGDDDSLPRHVSNWLVEKIVANFITINGGTPGPVTGDRAVEEGQPFTLSKNF